MQAPLVNLDFLKEKKKQSHASVTKIGAGTYGGIGNNCVESASSGRLMEVAPGLSPTSGGFIE